MNPNINQQSNFLNNLKFLLDTENVNGLTVKDGIFRKKSSWDQITYNLRWKRSEVDKKIKGATLNIIKGICEQIENQKINHSISIPGLNKELTKVEIKQLLFEKINRLNQKQFYLKDDFPFITKVVQNYLNDDLNNLRKAKSENIQLRDNSNHKLMRKIAKAQLVTQFGIGIKANKGTTGTVIVRDFNGKELGIFKTDMQHSNLCMRIKNIFKRLFFGQLHYLKHDNFIQPQAEFAAYLVDQFFGFNLTPASKITRLLEKDGTFQLFLQNYKEAKDVLSDLQNSYNPTDSELDKVQMMTVFDYLIGNLDRHEENWFLKLKQELENHHSGIYIEEIKLIDNANSFIVKNPSWLSTLWIRNQYKWKKLKIAQQPFSANTRSFINQKLNPENILNSIEYLNKNLPGFLNANMQQLFVNRAKVLYSLANDSQASPATLSNYVTHQEINA